MILRDAKDYKGCSHIHSTYSDGSGTMEEIVEAGREAGLDFIVVTDHNTLEPKYDGWQGWHDGLLVVVGAEASPRHMGHCVALGIERCRNYRGIPPDVYLKEVQEQGGMAFVAHPLGKTKRLFRVRLAPWAKWDLDGLAGMEIWSYMHDWIDELTLLKFWSHYRKPHAQISGPDPKVLAIWDELTRRRRVVAISGLDVHARKSWPIPILNVFPYSELFKTIRTHVIVPSFSGDDLKDVKLVEEAHRGGRCYVAYDLLADATGFSFTGESGRESCHMGATLPLAENATLSVRSPYECEIRLLRHGEEVASGQGTQVEHETGLPGAYRVEATIDGQPWVFTNPIYVVE